ncbi:ABC transporter substrate-binding protein [Chitinasiproducens palmae]|uniref:ABC transporter substrate-binding protein n=1 Tax=Chitinasiproducens palmae TaxID=1770053 RepID=UPI001F34AAC2|nr:ABC transporter substrate-binding protein [Chitinasiproducens palmae]
MLTVASAHAQQRGGVLTSLIYPEPGQLTTAFDTQLATGVVSTNVFDGLISYDAQGNPVPSLATSWQTSTDGKAITFHLRQGVKWHDGKSFTSADVRYSALEVWKKVHPRGRVTFANLVDVQTPDANTAVFQFAHPSPVVMSVLNAMEAPVLPAHLYKGTDVLANPYNQKPVGTGPFVFEKWQHGDYVQLKRNPAYWDSGKPYVDSLVFRIIPDAGARAAMLESGEAQYAPHSLIALQDIERLKGENLKVETRGYAWSSPFLTMEVNLRHPILKNLKVRQALAHAIDREQLVKVIWFGLGKPATGPVPSSVARFYTPDVTRYAYDPAAANKLLDEAGYPRKANGVRFTLREDYMPFNNFDRSAQFIKQNLKRVGIDVVVRAQDVAGHLRSVYGTYDYDIDIAQFSSFLDPQVGVDRILWSKAIKPGVPFANASGYTNPVVDQAIEASQIEGDGAKRVAQFHTLQQQTLRDLPILPLMELHQFTVYSPKLHGVNTTVDGAFSSLKGAWLDR